MVRQLRVPSQKASPTDPSQGPKGSIRRTILENYKELGLESEPTKGDNGVHASASPLEGLAEKANWLGIDIENDPFGKALLDSGITKAMIKAWSVDPLVNLDDGSQGSIFDTLEDLNVEECIAKMVDLNRLNL